ncbi:MAG: hydrogenase iron-sulfur subunit [Clostridiales bacterium]|nr:hydrogenase iron-sulfur subunit [Clostridiales bacterium]
MNVLIVGNNGINEPLGQRLQDEGFAAYTIADPSEIIRVRRKGEEYAVCTAEKEYSAASVIITEKPVIKDAEFFGARALNLADAGLATGLMAVKGPIKIVFLLDFPGETPEYMTAMALESATALAKAKKEVFFLSMFVKAASDGMEQMYLEARRAGVTFIKYEDVYLDFDEDKGWYAVKASDGVFDTLIETPYLVATGDLDLSSLDILRGKFRLAKAGAGGGIAGEFKYFLSTAQTSRKDVFYYHPGLDGGDALGGLDKWLPGIICEIRQNAKPLEGSVHASVDAQKCAFCYTCYRVCTHAALEPDPDAGAMACVESACMGCGACAAVCPGEAISMEGGEEDLVFDNVTPGEEAGCMVFCCENSAAPIMDEILKGLGDAAEKVSFASMPCGGRLGQEVIAAALATYGKVLVAVCMDDACRHMDGDKRACRQAERTVALLEKAGLEGKKIKCVKVSHAMPKAFEEDVKAFL